MACHNRRAQTVACLRALFASDVPPSASLEVFLLDDASSDGTRQAVQSEFARVKVIAGTGALFWNGGMRHAFEYARSTAPDHYLWLNDDTTLYRDSIARMISVAREREQTTTRPSIIVGSTRDPTTSQLTYGGLVRTSPWRPLRLARVAPGDEPVECDTFNGNCVLVPASVAKVLGNLDGEFVHSMGDTDYGFRAHAHGFGVWILPGFAGVCAHDHSTLDVFVDEGGTLARRWRRITSPKGLPVGQWYALTRRHGGPLWFLAFGAPYVKMLSRVVKSFVVGRRSGAGSGRS